MAYLTAYAVAEHHAVRLAIATLEANARARFPDMRPVAALEFEARVCRDRLEAAKQPEPVIAALLNVLASMTDGVLIEFGFEIDADASTLSGPGLIPVPPGTLH